MPNVQVILKEKITSLGAEADVVTVRAGYARNYLVPQGKAFEATAGNLRHVNNLKTKRSEREAAEKIEAQNVAGKLRKATLKMDLEIGQGGKSFGAITAADIAAAIKEQVGVVIDRHMIELEKPIKSSGKHDIVIRIHPEIEATVKLVIGTPVEEVAVVEAP